MAALTTRSVGALGNADVASASSATTDTITIPAGTAQRNGGYELQPTFIIVTNGDSGAHTVAVGGATAVSVAAGKTAIFPVYSEGYGDTSVSVVSSAVTSQTISVVRLTGA
jgi:hypothetical protein